MKYDFNEVRQIILNEMAYQNITWRSLADEIGIDHTSLFKTVRSNEPRWNRVTEILNALGIKLELN